MSTISPDPIRNRCHFRKGQSGNPAGRPRGSRNKATLAAEALLAGTGQRLTRELVEHALDSGDPGLLRYCLVRLLPPARRRAVVRDLAAGGDAGTVAASLAAVVGAVADGVISPLEARDIVKAITVRRGGVGTLDLRGRLTRLENAARERSRLQESAPPSADCPSPAPRERVPSEARRVRVSEAPSIAERCLDHDFDVDADPVSLPSPSHCLRNGPLPLPQCGRGVISHWTESRNSSVRRAAFASILPSACSFAVFSDRASRCRDLPPALRPTAAQRRCSGRARTRAHDAPRAARNASRAARLWM